MGKCCSYMKSSRLVNHGDGSEQESNTGARNPNTELLRKSEDFVNMNKIFKFIKLCIF